MMTQYESTILDWILETFDCEAVGKRYAATVIRFKNGYTKKPIHRVVPIKNPCGEILLTEGYEIDIIVDGSVLRIGAGSVTLNIDLCNNKSIDNIYWLFTNLDHTATILNDGDIDCIKYIKAAEEQKLSQQFALTFTKSLK